MVWRNINNRNNNKIKMKAGPSFLYIQVATVGWLGKPQWIERGNMFTGMTSKL